MSTKKSSQQNAKKTVPHTVLKRHSTGHKHQLHHHAQVLPHTTYDIPLRDRVETDSFLPIDIHDFIFHEGSVDEVRTLQERVYLRPRGEKALYLVVFDTLTHQAQNALLKLLEDPPQHAVLVLGVTSPRTLLETIRSRVHVLEDDVHINESEVHPQKLLDASLPQRLMFVESIVERRDVDAACVLIDATLRLILVRHADNLKVLQDQTRAAVSTSTYLRMQGAMVKILIESWVLTLPQHTQSK